MSDDLRKDLAMGRLKMQLAADTIWCFPCGLAGTPVALAVTRILISGEDMPPMGVEMCPACARRRLADPLPNDVGCEPVEQPAWTSIARELFTVA